ncbi:unnamed protein product [Coregonus sp. 'balchen']|nr:unnamed protein product [Coregonus sp. 'balchen']
MFAFVRSYFASHFIMGGERFDSTHPEGYLFGENTDLNFLGTRPVVFPYAAPPPQEPVKTLRSLINIRKDTLRLVRCSEDLKLPGEDVAGKSKACYNIEFTFDADTQLLFDMDKDVFPMVVHAIVDEEEDHMGHSHVLLATFERVADAEISDNSAECVVCLSDVRDTLILPCRHLCLCNACADTLRYQANCCPICRLPFRALLQIRAMRKKLSHLSPARFNPASDHIPPGFEVVSLLEALNGPLSVSPSAPPLQDLSGGHVSGTLPPYSNPVSSSLAQSVMSMALSHSQHSQISTDTLSSMSGSYLAGPEGEVEGGDAEGEKIQDAPMESRGPSQQDGEGNDVTEEHCPSPSHKQGGWSRCLELANNNHALCDTTCLGGLDNEQVLDSRFAVAG